MEQPYPARGQVHQGQTLRGGEAQEGKQGDAGPGGEDQGQQAGAPQAEQQPQGGDRLKIVLPPIPVHPVELALQPEGGQHRQHEQQAGQSGQHSGQQDKAGQPARREGARPQDTAQKWGSQKQGGEAGEKAARQKEGLPVPGIAAEAMDGPSQKWQGQKDGLGGITLEIAECGQQQAAHLKAGMGTAPGPIL